MYYSTVLLKVQCYYNTVLLLQQYSTLLLQYYYYYNSTVRYYYSTATTYLVLQLVVLGGLEVLPGLRVQAPGGGGLLSHIYTARETETCGVNIESI